MRRVTRSHGATARGALLVASLVLVTGCSSTSAKEQATETANAKSLVSAAHAAGVADGLTVGVAESLYGTSAPQLCDVLKDGISSAESMLLTGSPSGRRGKLITTDAVTYERLVVKTYCPHELTTYDDLVADIDPTDTTG